MIAATNANDWELVTQNRQSTTTIKAEDYTSMGLLKQQALVHQMNDDPSDPKKAYTIKDTLTATYNALEQYQLCQLEGTSVDSRTGQSTSALTTNLVNPNGGSAGLYRGMEPWKMLFTNYDGGILRQTVLFDSKWPPQSWYVSVRNLVTPGGNFWGGCDEPDPRRPYMSNPMIIPTSYSVGRGGGRRIVPNTQGLNDTSLLSGDNYLYSRQKLPFERSLPPPLPDTCQVAMGDTFEQISNRFGVGDELAPMLRAINGYSGGENPRPDQTLRLINSFFNTVHINDRTHPSYQVFIQQMRGSLYPHFKVEPPKPHQPHHSFLKMLAEVIAGALVIAIAPYLAHFVILPLIYGGTIGVALGAGVAATGAELLVTAVTGTLLNLGYQGIVSKDVSVLQAVVNGFTLYIGGAAQAAALVGKTESVLAELGMKFLSATSIAVLSQLATMAQTGHFEIGEVFANIFMQFATAGLPLPKNIPGQFAEGVIDGAGASLLNSVATGQRIRALDVAASALGTGIVKGGMAGIDIREAEIQRTHDMARARAQAMQQAMAEASAAERMQPAARQASTAPVPRQTGHRQISLQELEARQDQIDGISFDQNARLPGVAIDPSNPNNAFALADGMSQNPNARKVEAWNSQAGRTSFANAGNNRELFFNRAWNGMKGIAQNFTQERNNLFWQTVNAIDTTGNAFVGRLNADANAFYNANGLASRTKAFADFALTAGMVLPIGEGANVGARTLFAGTAKLLDRVGGLWSTGSKISESTQHIENAMKTIEQYMGEGMRVTKPGMAGKSDLILTSADGTKQIRFDVKNSHGLEPHVNVETWINRNLYPGDERMVIDENLHVYPRNDLNNEYVPTYAR